jgi:MFS transporter, DHA1 family, multidrug resistance protein
MKSWVWLLVLYSIAGFFEASFWGQLGAFTPLYLTKIGVRPEDVSFWTGAIVFISIGLGLPFLPLWGALADKYARQPIIVRSFAAHVLAGLLAVAAGNVWVFVLARTVQAFSFGNSGLMIATLTEHVPTRRQGFALSIMNSAPAVGAFVGPLLGGPIVDAYGVRILILINTIVMLLVTLAMALGYRDTHRGTDRGSLMSMAFGAVGLVTRSPRLRGLFAALLFGFSGWMMANTYIALAVKRLYPDEHHLGTAVGVVLGMGGLIAMVLSPALGLVADRRGLWRTLRVLMIVVVLLWPLPALTNNLILFGSLWAALNATLSATFALSFGLLSGSATAEQRGRVMTFSYVPVNLAGIVGAAVGSLVTRWSIPAIFPAGAVLTAFGVVLLFYAMRQPAPGVTPELDPALASARG